MNASRLFGKSFGKTHLFVSLAGFFAVAWRRPSVMCEKIPFGRENMIVKGGASGFYSVDVGKGAAPLS